MKTQIVKIDPERIDDSQLLLIKQVLLRDGVMAYPTETFYGLGAVCSSNRAVRKIYRLKKRDRSKALSLVVSDLEMAVMIVSQPSDAFYVLAEEYWPGPLTLVLKAAASFPADRTGPGRSLALRIPPLPWLRRVIQDIGYPITASSANISGRPGLSSAADVVKVFEGKVDLIVDGGPTSGNKPSTIVDISEDEIRLIREGAIPFIKIEDILHKTNR